MKWFQIDADTPNDPKIRAILARFGNEGFGVLIRLWCYVAAHGTKRPGWSLDSSGKPIEKAVLVEAAGTSEKKFDDLMRECTRNGHVRKNPYLKRGVVSFPAMSRRADPYTRSRVRTNSAHAAKKVSLQYSTVQDSNTPLPPFQKGGRVTRKQLHLAELQRERVYMGCPHEPRCANATDCVRQLAQAMKVGQP